MQMTDTLADRDLDAKTTPNAVAHALTCVVRWLRRAWRALTPGPRAWRGAAWGALAALSITLLAPARAAVPR